MATFSFGATVTQRQRSAGTSGRDGVVTYTWTDTDIPGCAVWPRTSAETVQGQDLVTTGVTVFAPPGTVVAATDRFVVDGQEYEVVGDPAAYQSPLSGTYSGVEIQLERTAG